MIRQRNFLYGSWKQQRITIMPRNSNKLVQGVGRKGNGIAKVNGKNTKPYSIWTAMLQRCYDQRRLSRQPTYIGCSVCNEWLFFPNFKEWFDNNYVEGWELDKDLLVTENKVYSPETCIFVPHSINVLFIDSGAARGKYPIGVYLHKQSGKFQAHLKIDGKVKYLGYFDKPEDAHQAYLIAKKENVIRMTSAWKEKIPIKLYGALLAKGIGRAHV